MIECLTIEVAYEPTLGADEMVMAVVVGIEPGAVFYRPDTGDNVFVFEEAQRTVHGVQ